MKIALIDPSLFTWPYDSALADGLRQNGNAVTLYTKHLAPGEPGHGAPYLREIFYPGLQRPWAARLPKKLFLTIKGVLHIWGMLQLWFVLRNARPDVIHFQWAPLPPVDRLFMPLFRKLAPIVLTVHDSSPFNNNPTSRLQSLGAIKIMGAFDRLIVHTAHARERLLAYGREPARVAQIPHGILDSGMHALAVTDGQLPPVTSGERPVSLLLFGKLKPYKGADILVRALAALPPATRAKTRLRIVGKAEMDLAPLQALVAELGVGNMIDWDLRFIGDTEMGTIFAAADIMVIPYREIDASGVLMVALGMARPIVASRIGLFAELLQDGREARLVPPEDPAALAAALAPLIESPHLRAEMGQAVATLRTSIPDWRQIAAKTADLYRAI